MKKIYFDSFPRSGNHYFLKNFYKNFNYSQIVWGLHNINFLNKKNMITVVRNPIDSIISYSIMNNNIEIKDIFKNNNIWLKKTLENKNSIYIINFNSLIKNTEKEIIKIKNKYSLDYEKKHIIFPSEDIYNSVEQGFYPNKERNKIKNKVKNKIEKQYKKNIEENFLIYKEIFKNQNDII